MEMSGQRGQAGGKAAFWSVGESSAEGDTEPAVSWGKVRTGVCPASHRPCTATLLTARWPPSGLAQRDAGRGQTVKDSSPDHIPVDSALGSVEAPASGPGIPGETPSWAWSRSVSHVYLPEASPTVKAAGSFSGRAASFPFSNSSPGPRQHVPHGSGYPEQSPRALGTSGQKEAPFLGPPWGFSVSGRHTAGPGLPLV